MFQFATAVLVIDVGILQSTNLNQNGYQRLQVMLCAKSGDHVSSFGLHLYRTRLIGIKTLRSFPTEFSTTLIEHEDQDVLRASRGKLIVQG